ncbi:MAG: type II toxin-antitoxin system HicA family toxin [Chloroflexi bacterium]|nr:type II toxin-antitoxin system HicA family toxin [Chloroflexota bacterium]
MSQIDFSKIRSLTAREIIRALIRDGFDVERQTGSHQQYYHPDGRRVTVSFHRSGDTFSLRILRIMIQDQARWTADDLRRLGLL